MPNLTIGAQHAVVVFYDLFKTFKFLLLEKAEQRIFQVLTETYVICKRFKKVCIKKLKSKLKKTLLLARKILLLLGLLVVLIPFRTPEN
jgi:hypothetical protein